MKTIILLIMLVLVSCSEKPHESNVNKTIESHCKSLNGSVLSCDFKDAICKGEALHFQDVVGDNKPFVDLTDMTMTIGEECIGFTITVDHIPEKLKINHDALPINALNYSWGVWVDINANSNPMDGDLMIAINQYKWEEDSETTKNITTNIFTTLFPIGGDTIAFISSSFSNNTFHLYIPKELDNRLSKIKVTTPLHFLAKFNDGNAVYRDFYPDDVKILQ